MERLKGGKQQGVDLITLNNGEIECRICPTRGMGLIDAWRGPVRLGWDSPVGEIVHPSFVNLESRGGLGWLEGFNEWVVRCGLESAGAPGRDRFITNQGDEAEMNLTLHGKIANIPASEVEILVQCAPPYRIRVIGRVFEWMLFGPKLELRTEVWTTPGSNILHLEDTVTNRGSHNQEFQLIYHCNHGTPLLEDGARFLAPVQRVFPINPHAARKVDRYDLFEAARTGFVEEVYCLEPIGDSEGKTTVMLRNHKGNRAAAMRYRVSELPCLTLWKNTAAEEDGYVAGLEPGTGFPYNRSIERRFGRVPILAGGESRSFRIDFLLLDSTSEVDETARLISAVQKGRKTQIDHSPPDLG
ncbi:MAG: aldose 1-epimerase family protein [Acidobacteriota bacterium]|nr:MAG: aldose 1-epimerase family protein [Acidobacteriota bacterium]